MRGYLVGFLAVKGKNVRRWKIDSDLAVWWQAVY